MSRHTFFKKPTLVRGAIGVAIMAGMAVMMVTGMDTVVVVVMAMDMVDTNLDIRNPMATCNLFISHHPCTIRHNPPASVCLFRLILVGRYRLKRAHVNAMN